MQLEATGRKDYYVVAALACAAALTRIYGLSNWDFLVDEFATVASAEERMTGLVNPAYYALTWLGFKAFGVSEFTARAPAMLFGVAAVPVFYLTWKNVFGRYTALVGAIFVLLSSWHLWFSQFARFYSAIFFFGSLSYYVFWRAVGKDDIRTLALALVLNVIGVLFHLTSIFVPISCAAFALVAVVGQRFEIYNQSLNVAKIYLVICAIAGLCLLPFMLGSLGRWGQVSQDWGSEPVSLLLQIVKYVQLPLFVAACLGALQMARAGLVQWLILTGIGVPLFFVVALSAVTTIRPDYLFYALPLVFLSAGYLCSQIRGPGNVSPILTHSLSIVLAVSLLPEFVSHYRGHSSLDVREVIDFVQGEYRQGDMVLPLVSGVDYYGDKRLEIGRRPGTAYDDSPDWQRLMDEHLNVSGRIWIVMPSKREPIAAELRKWLGENASLVWRRHESRYDYTFRGYEVYVVRPDL